MGRWANHRSFLFTMKGESMIKVRSKTLFIPAEEQSIGAVGEADSTVREFHIDRVSGDGVDLANLLFKLNIRYAGVREIDRSDLEKVVTDNAIILRWLISSVTLRNAGTAFLQLDAFDETGSCRWKSYPGAVYIEKSIGTEDIPKSSLSELEQLEKRFTQIGDGEKARVEAEKKRVSAEEKREEAEKKRNTSLANIIAEEEKIKALSTETKGYRDSVKTDKDAITADKQAITAIKNEAVSARETAQQHASAAEASKNNTITEGAKIKEAVITLKNEASIAKTEAVNAKNEVNNAKNEANNAKEVAKSIKSDLLTLKNEANTIKGEVQALKNETESRIQSAESNIQNQVMNATSYAGMAEMASQQAEGYKMEAGVSAEKAKESETKTLEALKKAQESGAASGISTEEMKSYVETIVPEMVKSKINNDTLQQISNDNIYSLLLGSANLENIGGYRPLVGAVAIAELLRWVRDLLPDLLSENANGKLKLLNSGLPVRVGRGLERISRMDMARSLLSVGDVLKWNYDGHNQNLYIAGMGMYGMKDSIDFVSFDFPINIELDQEAYNKMLPWSAVKLNKLISDTIMNDPNFSELKNAVNNGHIKKVEFVEEGGERAECPFWTFGVGEVVSTTDILLYALSSGVSDKLGNIGQYPLFKQERFRRALGKGEYITSTCFNGNVVVIDKQGKETPRNTEKVFMKGHEGEKLIIPVCFRVEMP